MVSITARQAEEPCKHAGGGARRDLCCLVGARGRTARRRQETPLELAGDHRASVSGTELHFVDAGMGPALQLLHGWPITWRHWRQLIPILVSEGWRVVLLPELERRFGPLRGALAVSAI